MRKRLTLLSRAKARFGLVCALQGAFPATLQTAAPRSSSGAVGEMWPWFSAPQFASGVIAVVRAEKVFERPILSPQEGEHIGSGFQAPENPNKAAGPREPEAAQPRFARRRAAGWVRNGLRCFPEQRRGVAGLCSPRSFSCPFADCRAQELGWCLWGVGALVRSGPASLGLYCWGMGEEGLRTFNLASP